MANRLRISVVVAVILLAGCGSSEDVTPETSPSAAATSPPSTQAEEPTTPTAPSLEDAVQAYTTAFLGGDADAAYALLTQRCRNETARNNFADIVRQATAQWGGETIIAYEEKVNGNVATATYELSDPVLNQTEERWILEDGGWHNDEC
jgi:hypothetical protein